MNSASPALQQLDERTRTWIHRTSLTACLVVCAWLLWENFLYSYTFIKPGNTYSYLPDVTPGWFFGYFIDLSDMQWREWRKNGLLLIVAFSAYVGISRLIRANARPLLRIFYLISGVGGMFVMHGAGAIWVILSIGIAFIAARVLRTPPLVAWVLHISILLLVHFDHVPLFNHFIPFGIGLWLDGWHGMLPWKVYYKMLLLRYISFHTDYYYHVKKVESRPHHKTQLDESPKPAGASRPGQGNSIPPEEMHSGQFSLANFIAYSTYLPLHIAGPIISFHSFVHSMRHAQTDVPVKTIIREAVKVGIYWVLFEIGIHFIHAYSMNISGVYKRMPSTMLSIIAYLTLNFMYMKFLIIWRTFRTFSLLDGIYTPENMRRCITDGATFKGFWRFVDHIRSNVNQTRIFSIWFIFGFVALWHEISFNWLLFGVMNAAGVAIESILVVIVYDKQKLFNPSPNRAIIIIPTVLLGAINLMVLIFGTFAINQGAKLGDFLYQAFWRDTDAIINFFVTWGVLTLVATAYYFNPNKHLSDVSSKRSVA